VRGDSFEVVACGVDDLTIGFDMTGSRSIRRLEETPGVDSRRGKMLGDRSSWGSFAHLLGRSVSFWRRETSRLYVQAKLADEGCLCRLKDLGGAVEQLLERMALVGVESFEPAWVTRIDVAVDAVCRPAYRVDSDVDPRDPRGFEALDSDKRHSFEQLFDCPAQIL